MSFDYEFPTIPEDINEQAPSIHDHGSQMTQLYTKIAQKIKRFGVHKLQSKAVIELSKTNNIILVGPPKVGKSTTISIITGEEAKASPGLFSCTQKVASYETSGMTFWDTPGVESWKSNDVKSFMDEIFIKNRILPLSIIIVLAPGCFISKNPILEFINIAKKYKIQVIFEITKAYALNQEQHMSYLNTIIELTDTKSLTSIYKYTKALDNNMYIIYLNLLEFKPIHGKSTRAFGIIDLCKVLYAHQDTDTKTHLIQMYSDNADFWSKMGAIGFDVLFSAGIPIEQLLDDKERDVYMKITKDNFRLSKDALEPFMRSLSPKQ